MARLAGPGGLEQLKGEGEGGEPEKARRHRPDDEHHGDGRCDDHAPRLRPQTEPGDRAHGRWMPREPSPRRPDERGRPRALVDFCTARTAAERLAFPAGHGRCPNGRAGRTLDERLRFAQTFHPMLDPLVGVAARILPAAVDRLDHIAAQLGAQRPGEVVKRSDAMRAAIERGVDIMERELKMGDTPKEKSKPARRPAKK